MTMKASYYKYLVGYANGEIVGYKVPTFVAPIEVADKLNSGAADVWLWLGKGKTYYPRNARAAAIAGPTWVKIDGGGNGERCADPRHKGKVTIAETGAPLPYVAITDGRNYTIHGY